MIGKETHSSNLHAVVSGNVCRPSRRLKRRNLVKDPLFTIVPITSSAKRCHSGSTAKAAAPVHPPEDLAQMLSEILDLLNDITPHLCYMQPQTHGFCHPMSAGAGSSKLVKGASMHLAYTTCQEWKSAKEISHHLILCGHNGSHC